MISETGLPGLVLALHRTTHCTLHALGSTLAGLNLGAAEINALANLAERGALNVRELGAETWHPCHDGSRLRGFRGLREAESRAP